MTALLPCPLCSSVIHDGALTRPVIVAPSWLYAKMTTAKCRKDHFSWMGCAHAAPMGAPIPTNDRETTEARWNVEARRLLELRTASWPADKRDSFAKILGFTTANPV